MVIVYTFFKPYFLKYVMVPHIYIYYKPKLRENQIRIFNEFQLESNCKPCVPYNFLFLCQVNY